MEFLPSVRNCGHGMKELSTLISKANSVYSVSFPPIFILVSKLGGQLILDQSPEVAFRIKEVPSIFQAIGNKITLLQLEMRRERFDRPLLHAFRVLLSFLNFAETNLAILLVGYDDSQQFRTVSRNSG